MEASKVITYSLLAQIRNSGNFVNSSVEIFVPIVKYALYKLITQSIIAKFICTDCKIQMCIFS